MQVLGARMRIFYVPIEPLEERYTASWYRNIPAYFSSQGAEVVVIDGEPLTDTVKVGSFLDINSTVHYKCSQMKAIAKLFAEGAVRNWDVFFFGDIEFWGIEALRLMAQLNHKRISIFGVLHAASYSIEDTFSVAADYQQYTELGWIAACDAVFVGSDYHRNAVIQRRLSSLPKWRAKELAHKIFSSGLPLFAADYASYPDVEKHNQVVIAGRLDYERRPNLSLDFAYLLKKRFGDDISIVMTVPSPNMNSNRAWLVEYAQNLEKDGVLTVHKGLRKDPYHRILAESKVFLSNTVEENFGYACIEACVYGCCPVVKNGFSYPELLAVCPDLLFDSEDEILEIVIDVLEGSVGSAQEVAQCAKRYYGSLDRMWECMTKGPAVARQIMGG